MRRIALVVHNVRSAHNVGSLLRTADGLGANIVYLTGYSPYPAARNDSRPAHIGQKASRAIHKTALGAEDYVKWVHRDSLRVCLKELREAGYEIAALEQTKQAVNLGDFSNSKDIALIVGNEVSGIDEPDLKEIETHLKIPMLGKKESFNVAVAAAMALYHLRYLDKKTP